MKRDLISSALAVLVFTALFGLAYPLLTTGAAQVLFPNKADGSQVERGGKVIGSRQTQSLLRGVFDTIFGGGKR